jgi:hypothetical protein
LSARHALLISLGQLRDAVDRGDNFVSEMAVVRLQAPSDELALLDNFAAGAESGIARREQLRSRFAALSESLLAQEYDRAQIGFWPSLRAHLHRIVRIRRIDGMGNDVEAILARTEMAIKADDWDKALLEMSALSGPFATTAESWVHQVELRLAADRALSRLTALAAARSSQAPSPP